MKHLICKDSAEDELEKIYNGDFNFLNPYVQENSII